MGEVYRAEDTRLGRTVAVKVLHAGPTCPDERARLFREARAASVLRSSNIAAIYDLGEHGDRPFIVMELVAGEALSARLTRGPLPIPEAVSIAAQAADALDEAHGHGIIHRDVKSANLMVDGRGRVKLLDFGLAKYDERPTASSITTGALLETQPGTVMGTFTYMSPEQVRGRALDARSDLFSLGVVLYEMLTGRLPFEGADRDRRRRSHPQRRSAGAVAVQLRGAGAPRRDRAQGAGQGSGVPLSVGARALHRPARRRPLARGSDRQPLARAIAVRRVRSRRRPMRGPTSRRPSR